jgi:hypothetical protein
MKNKWIIKNKKKLLFTFLLYFKKIIFYILDEFYFFKITLLHNIWKTTNHTHTQYSLSCLALSLSKVTIFLLETINCLNDFACVHISYRISPSSRMKLSKVGDSFVWNLAIFTKYVTLDFFNWELKSGCGAFRC